MLNNRRISWPGFSFLVLLSFAVSAQSAFTNGEGESGKRMLYFSYVIAPDFCQSDRLITQTKAGSRTSTTWFVSIYGRTTHSQLFVFFKFVEMKWYNK